MHASDIAAARQRESKQSKPKEVICGQPKLRAVGGMIGRPHEDIVEGPPRSDQTCARLCPAVHDQVACFSPRAQVVWPHSLMKP